MGADFKAFQTYLDAGWDDNSSYLSIPRNGEGPTKNFFLFNVASSTFSETQKELNVAALQRHVADNTNSLFNKGIVSVRSYINLSANNPHALSFMSAAASMEEGIAFVDQRITKEIFSITLNHLPPEQHRLHTQDIRHHEAAHLILDLKEPGSDFVSSVLMLRSDPENKDFLRAKADLRLLNGMNYGEKDYKKYGAECHDAIEHALSLSPEKIRSLSLEEMHTIAKRFDAQNERNANMDFSPEAEARERLSSPLNSFDVKRGLQRVWNHATGNLPTIDEIARDISKGNFAELGQKVFENGIPTKGDLRKLFQNEIIGTNTMRESLTRIQPDHTTEAGRIVEDVREAIGRRSERHISIPALMQ